MPSFPAILKPTEYLEVEAKGFLMSSSSVMTTLVSPFRLMIRTGSKGPRSVTVHTSVTSSPCLAVTDGLSHEFSDDTNITVNVGETSQK